MNLIILILIVTQIIVESLPISSSGHLALIGLIVQKKLGAVVATLPDFIDSMLHITAMLAILIVFYKDWSYPATKLLASWRQLALGKIGFASEPVGPRALSFAQKRLNQIFFKIVGLILVADLITSVFYFFIKIVFKDFFAAVGPIGLLVGFVVTAMLLLSLRFKSQGTSALTLKKSILLGMVQGIALLPGISRFASTYAAGCWLNLRPARAFQVSFLLHFPLICAEVFLLGLPKFIKHLKIAQGLSISSLVIILLATVCAVFLLNLCYRLAIKNKLWWFGIYMLIPILTLLFLYKKTLPLHYAMNKWF